MSLLEQIPKEVKEFIATNSAIYRTQVLQQYPHLAELLGDEKVRETVLTWLATDEAHDKANAEFAMNCLKFIRAGAIQSEAPVVRTFLLHDDPLVRLRAYEFLLTLYFPDKNIEAMFLLLHSMLSDENDTVRKLAARYIERADAVDELRTFLERWYKDAPKFGWESTESYELVGQLLGK